MTDTLSSDFPSTREEAQQRLEAFLSVADRYAAKRNHVVPGHPHVSRLSPATRTRLLLETEICEAGRERFSPHEIEKFEQEVWWRLYWKGWLEQRPAVWTRYREELAELEWSERAEQVAAGESGVAIMDLFAKELVETGYLHNHARMWWAAFWIHVEKLPWQLGADFFLRHLLDGDAASNTLSWRWVAGLHTRGKRYLVRRSNLEKYVDSDLLSVHGDGLSRLEGTAAIELPFVEHPEIVKVTETPLPETLPERTGIWIHDEDLLLEDSPLAGTSPSAIGTFAPLDLWENEGYPEKKRRFLLSALRDGAIRAEKHFGALSVFEESDVWIDALVNWSRRNGLEAVLTMKPMVGPLADRWHEAEQELDRSGTRLIGLLRDHDVAVFSKATAGFFGFWKKTASLRC